MRYSAGCSTGYSVKLRLGSLNNESKVNLLSNLPQQPDEGLLKLVVALGRNVIVLQVLLPVEGNLLGLDLPVLHIHLVTHQNNGNVLTHSNQVLVPLRHILIGNS